VPWSGRKSFSGTGAVFVLGAAIVVGIDSFLLIDALKI
jgi:hypothetical protein